MNVKHLSKEDAIYPNSIPVRYDVNKQTNEGRTILFTAAADNDVYFMKQVIDQGADINKADIYHYTPIQIAVLKGSIAALQTLIEAGAEINKYSR